MRPRIPSGRESNHPLFRALVLMGGSIALGCGGSVVVDSSAAGSGGKVALGGASPGGNSQGGAAATAGTIMLAGGGGNSAIDAGAPDCPPAQWDCSGLVPACEPNLGGPRPAGCVCDLTRPKSVADCGSNEDLICLRGYGSEPDPNTWDMAVHYQCACVPGPPVPSYDTCPMACAKTYSMSSNAISCSLPPSTSCDSSNNNCTATAANVLRQDGIVCGCAPILLK